MLRVLPFFWCFFCEFRLWAKFHGHSIPCSRIDKFSLGTIFSKLKIYLFLPKTAFAIPTCDLILWPSLPPLLLHLLNIKIRQLSFKSTVGHQPLYFVIINQNFCFFIIYVRFHFVRYTSFATLAFCDRGCASFAKRALSRFLLRFQCTRSLLSSRT